MYDYLAESLFEAVAGIMLVVGPQALADFREDLGSQEERLQVLAELPAEAYNAGSVAVL